MVSSKNECFSISWNNRKPFLNDAKLAVVLLGYIVFFFIKNRLFGALDSLKWLYTDLKKTGWRHIQFLKRFPYHEIFNKMNVKVNICA